MTCLRRAAPAAFLIAFILASAAKAQPPGYPNAPPHIYVPQPPATTSANGGAALPPSAMASPPPTAYPPAYYNPYGYPGYQGAVGGALTGTANVISAQGQYMNSAQQARLVQTQADMSRIDYRNALIQQQRYEQSLSPTTVELRQQQQWRNLQSARNNPPRADIWSGVALNALYTALQGADRSGLRADPVMIDPDVLSHVNLTTGQASGAGAGMLKNVTNLDWPFALQDAPYQDPATKIQALATQAVGEVRSNGRVTAATFNQLNMLVSNMDDAIGNDKSLSPTDYITSKTFVDNLQSSIQSFRDPNVAKYLNNAYAAKGPTVADLVSQMSSQGLTFAPATQADQPAYTVLYQAFLTYDYRLSQLASR